MTSRKVLILICAGGVHGVVDVAETDTLANVRNYIENELDDDLLIPGFAFHLNNVRISRKQEHRKMAWQILRGNKVVSLQAKIKKKKEDEKLKR